MKSIISKNILLIFFFLATNYNAAQAFSGPDTFADLAEKVSHSFPNLKAIGLDIVSISSFQHREVGRIAHKEFLGRNILLIEDMYLSDTGVPNSVIVAPLRVDYIDSAPCTVIGFYD